ncbi:hypothetical protein CBW65_02005 [Tumebacillus avium]|uniref:Tyr recombinase domain-containing protein n=1 Tax=Tumebacillus avium TaxID=1903704 RepID=A0A1Y0IIR9_9BACL|nr:tyrosine-type recombinase/integrase [Tumebacillus avium]ARU59969.1 hypothetical protein CBW65_02005 [Tumebacillus avium]
MGRKRRDWPMTEKQKRIYENLWHQVEKLFNYRNHDQGFRGTERYREGLRAFCKYLAIHYGSKNFRNISDQHLQSFIGASQRAGVSTKTIKTDLAAIRKLHMKVDRTRYKLSDNQGIGYHEKRSSRGVDRAWRDSEVRNAIALARSSGRYDVAWSLGIARYGGLRIEEATALSKTQIRDALRKGYITLRVTKGGIPRDVPLAAPVRMIFREILEVPNSSERVFVRHGRTHHQAFKSIQNWIYNNREHFQERVILDSGYAGQMKIDERPDLTYHGLRHSYAREQYELRVEAGFTQREARQEVAALLGHGRDDVTRIYTKT